MNQFIGNGDPENSAAWERVRAISSRALSQSSSRVVGLTKKEAADFSIVRAIAAIALNDWSKAGFEREVSNAVETASKRQRTNERSFFMPTALPFQVAGGPPSRYLGQRAIYQVGTAGQGGNIVGTDLSAVDFIEVLRNATVIGQLGARFLTGLTENVDLPRQNSVTNTYWVGESTALTESEATFDKVSLRPHTVGALSKISRQMLQQSTPTIEQLVRDDLTQVDARAVDAAALYGTGSAQPTGIANTANVGSVVMGTNGGNATFDAMVQLYTAPAVANAPQANLAFAVNGKTKGYLTTLKSSTGQYLWNPGGSIAASAPDALVGQPYALSNQLPSNLSKGTSASNCSMAIYGNWQELLIGEWGALEIMVNPFDSVGFTTGDVVIRSMHTLDVGIRHPQSFAICTDLLTPGF